MTAVTPLHRGYPITSPVPTAYPNGKQTSDTDDTSEHAESDQLAEQVTDCDEKLVAGKQFDFNGSILISM